MKNSGITCKWRCDVLLYCFAKLSRWLIGKDGQVGSHKTIVLGYCSNKLPEKRLKEILIDTKKCN